MKIMRECQATKTRIFTLISHNNADIFGLGLVFMIKKEAEDCKCCEHASICGVALGLGVYVDKDTKDEHICDPCCYSASQG